MNCGSSRYFRDRPSVGGRIAAYVCSRWVLDALFRVCILGLSCHSPIFIISGLAVDYELRKSVYMCEWGSLRYSKYYLQCAWAVAAASSRLVKICILEGVSYESGSKTIKALEGGSSLYLY